jgi:hypothetical protein
MAIEFPQIAAMISVLIPFSKLLIQCVRPRFLFMRFCPLSALEGKRFLPCSARC